MPITTTLPNLGGGDNDNVSDEQVSRELLHTLHSEVQSLRRGQDEIRKSIVDLSALVARQHQAQNANIRRLQNMLIPVFRSAAIPNNSNVTAAGGGTRVVNNNAGMTGNGVVVVVGGGVAALSKSPRTLLALWEEYQVGIGGRKPARLFTAPERGKVKYKYTRRKVVWATIDRLVRGGLTSAVAIDRIYTVYGRDLSVTKIINRMLQDRRKGTIPAILG